VHDRFLRLLPDRGLHLPFFHFIRLITRVPSTVSPSCDNNHFFFVPLHGENVFDLFSSFPPPLSSPVTMCGSPFFFLILWIVQEIQASSDLPPPPPPGQYSFDLPSYDPFADAQKSRFFSLIVPHCSSDFFFSFLFLTLVTAFLNHDTGILPLRVVRVFPKRGIGG